MNTSRDMTLNEFMSVIKKGKEKHEKRTGEDICVEVTGFVSEHKSVLYLEVRNHTTNMNCKKGIFIDELVNNEDPRSVLIDVFGKAIRKTTDWYVCNEREMEAC